MIKQLLKQIWVQRAINIWLWVELVVVFVCLSFLVDYLYTTATTYYSPTGYDTRHVYQVSLDKVPSDSNTYIENETDSMITEHLVTALQRMRVYPGIESVCVTSQAPPYSQRQANGNRNIDTTSVHGWIFKVTPEFFRVFRVADKQGRVEPLVEAAMQEKTVIASVDVEHKFALKGVTALHSGLKNPNAEDVYATIRAISGVFRFDEFQKAYPAYFQCMSEFETLKGRKIDSEFSVRVQSELDTPNFIEEFRNAMKTQLRLGNIYLLEVTSFKDIRTNYFRAKGDINEVKTYIAGLAFLLVNIFLGVVGTFWIRTQQRRSEMALRIALGASRGDIRKELLVEGMLLLFLAAIPGIVICANLIHWELFGNNSESPFTISDFAAGQFITLFLMLGMIIIGILFPARQAMKIQPAEALHEE